MTITSPSSSCFFFFNDTATTEIYTLSLHDALPICLDSAFLGSMRMRMSASSSSESSGTATGSRTRTRSRSEEHTSELQSRSDLVCRLLLEKKKHSSLSAHSITSAAPVVMTAEHETE